MRVLIFSAIEKSFKCFILEKPFKGKALARRMLWTRRGNLLFPLNAEIDSADTSGERKSVCAE